MGFDDIRYAAVTQPPLTTIAQPAREIGEHAMHRIMRAIAGEDIGTEVEIVPHRLVLRESTAAPASG
jgi:LacI family repressor for deo operon, udp, cdd, tsx, nupC, and nupG